MNNKGYTLLEMIVVLALSSILFYSAFFVPTFLYKENHEYSLFADSISDNYHLRKVISKDISGGTIEKVNESNVKIGSHVYEFSNVVKRDSVAITRNEYSFTIENSTIKIFNKDVEMKYSANSSFMRGEVHE